MSPSLRTSVSVLGALLLCISWPLLRHLVFPDLAAGPWIGAALFVAVPLLALGRTAVKDLGLDRADARGLAVGLGGSLAMAAVYVALGHKAGVPAIGELLRGTVVAAITEEVLFRGYAVRQLRERAGWSLLAAIAVPAALFGLGHLGGALAAGEAGNAIMTVLVTGAGGAWLGWLFTRWGFSLWVTIAVHFAMNTWWLVFSGGATAGAGGPGSLWGRAAAITIITVLTARLTRVRAGAPA